VPDTPAQRALFPEDSAIWKISRERVILLAGPAAAILQIAHPEVALGVQNHSSFREDSLARLHRTLEAVYTATFAPREEAEAMYALVHEKHAAVQGTSPRPYSAFSLDAQMWVLATLIMLAVESYERFIAPLTSGDKQAYYADMRTFGEGFGLPKSHGPQTWDSFVTYYEAEVSSPQMASLPICRELASAIARPERPIFLRLLWPASVLFTREFLPSPLAEKLGFPSTAGQRLMSAALQASLPSVLRHLPKPWRFERQYLAALRRLDH